MNRSQEAMTEALKYMPGGVNSPVRAFKSVGGTPPFIERGEGQWIYDIDGNRYLDMLSSWGPLILGHRNEDVHKAVVEAMERGFSFGAPTLKEVSLAELVVKSVPSIESVRFVNSGTEAVMSALRLARAYTGRNKIIKFDGCYHGHSDSMLVSAGSGMAAVASSKGVPESFLKETISLPYNDIEAVKKAFTACPDDIAAIILEPVAGNMGVVLPEEGYLEFLRDITEKHGSLLIFDEVITGFRLSLGGAQEVFGITPDLTTLGKVIGGGFPVGAYGGKKEIMKMVAPEGDMYQAGTLSGNPVAMAAGIATLEHLQDKDFYQKLNKKGEHFADLVRSKVEKYPVVINSAGSLMTLFFTRGPVTDYKSAMACDQKQFAAYFHSLLEQGIYISPSQFEAGFISSVHKVKELEWAADCIAEAVKKALS